MLFFPRIIDSHRRINECPRILTHDAYIALRIAFTDDDTDSSTNEGEFEMAVVFGFFIDAFL